MAVKWHFSISVFHSRWQFSVSYIFIRVKSNTDISVTCRWLRFPSPTGLWLYPLNGRSFRVASAWGRVSRNQGFSCLLFIGCREPNQRRLAIAGGASWTPTASFLARLEFSLHPPRPDRVATSLQLSDDNFEFHSSRTPWITLNYVPTTRNNSCSLVSTSPNSRSRQKPGTELLSDRSAVRSDDQANIVLLRSWWSRFYRWIILILALISWLRDLPCDFFIMPTRFGVSNCWYWKFVYSR